ncbi:hypothetical protein HELRODRAFT_183541 [Helobdella robusta]|uniref:HMG box domain-containing protein n=1 Tax=Helobdella robusta TaxID=6412 RepID=T1FJT6_HELRO|nr:hypothetical protein HELRODRAFT_183541 [Helobdella robusta]ESO10512.1 hypothetical protein HELRODRAFT_183541 [Helobdella robusta]
MPQNNFIIKKIVYFYHEGLAGSDQFSNNSCILRTLKQLKVKTEFPKMSVGDVSKELGKRWKVYDKMELYHNMALKDKERYEKEKALSAGGLGKYESMGAFAFVPSKKSAVSKKIIIVDVMSLVKKRKAQTEVDNDDNKKGPTFPKKATNVNKPPAKKSKPQIEDENDDFL